MSGVDIKQRVEELEQIQQSVSDVIKTRSAALANMQRLVAKYEYTMQTALKGVTDVRENSLMKHKGIDIDLIARSADYRRLLQV